MSSTDPIHESINRSVATSVTARAQRRENQRRAMHDAGLTPTIAAWLEAHDIKYDRAWDLPCVISVYKANDDASPDEKFSRDPALALAKTTAIIAQLAARMAICRQDGVDGHWTYQPSHQMALVACHAAEQAIEIWMSRTIAIRTERTES